MAIFNKPKCAKSLMFGRGEMIRTSDILLLYQVGFGMPGIGGAGIANPKAQIKPSEFKWILTTVPILCPQSGFTQSRSWSPTSAQPNGFGGLKYGIMPSLCPGRQKKVC